jgi:cyclic 2,3-diphosphoglycerate synthetase
MSVIGTGKRVGKTAVTGHLARLLARDRDVVVVAMGRGGPPEPELIEAPPTLDDLLALSRDGRHAASDHLELAALAGVVTIGCRRAGGGLAGQVLDSNVVAGAALARSLAPEVVVFDGSGAAIPPIATSARILVTGPEHDLDEYLNPYRVAISDLVIGIGDVPGADVRAALRLRPASPLGGRRVAVFTTGPAPVDHLDADVVHVSRNLADRDALRAELATVDAEVYLVELKAAAIDVVAEAAADSGAEVVLAENEVVASGLDDALLALIPEKVPA